MYGYLPYRARLSLCGRVTKQNLRREQLQGLLRTRQDLHRHWIQNLFDAGTGLPLSHCFVSFFPKIPVDPRREKAFGRGCTGMKNQKMKQTQPRISPINTEKNLG
jgi:hypothetical protein